MLNQRLKKNQLKIKYLYEKKQKIKAMGDSQPSSLLTPKEEAEIEPSTALSDRKKAREGEQNQEEGSGKRAGNRYFTISWNDAQGDGVSRFLNEVDDV